MESGKRSRNFTEREKMLLIEVAKEFVSIIDNKKTDGTTVDAKKNAWLALTNKFNAVSETGVRSEKQLHALYDNLKKKARKNISDDKSEMYKTGGGTFYPKTTTVDEKVVALLTPQFQPLINEFDSSAPYYALDTQENIVVTQAVGTSEQFFSILDAEEDSVPELQSVAVSENNSSKRGKSSKRPHSPQLKSIENTPQLHAKRSLTETKKRNIINLSDSIIKRKNQKQENEDKITAKRLEILELQQQQELLKIEKSTLLETAKIDLEFKRKNFHL